VSFGSVEATNNFALFNVRARCEGTRPGAGARGKRRQPDAAAKAFGTIEDFRAHDLRRTAASLMAAGGIPRFMVASAQRSSGGTARWPRSSRTRTAPRCCRLRPGR